VGKDFKDMGEEIEILGKIFTPGLEPSFSFSFK